MKLLKRALFLWIERRIAACSGSAASIGTCGAALCKTRTAEEEDCCSSIWSGSKASTLGQLCNSFKVFFPSFTGSSRGTKDTFCALTRPQQPSCTSRAVIQTFSHVICIDCYSQSLQLSRFHSLKADTKELVKKSPKGRSINNSDCTF